MRLELMETSWTPTVLPQIFRDTVLPGLAGQDHDEALEILERLEP